MSEIENAPEEHIGPNVPVVTTSILRAASLAVAFDNVDHFPLPLPRQHVLFYYYSEIWDGDILTNPPYGDAMKFCQHALDCVDGK